MKSRVEYRPYCVPFLRPVQTAHGLWSERRGVIARWVEEADAATSAAARSVHYAESAPLPHLSDVKADVPIPFFAHCLAPVPQDASPREVAALLPAGRAALAVLRERLGEGFRVFKWKVGVARAPAEELDILEELCAELAQVHSVNAPNVISDSETGAHREPAIMAAVAHRRLRLDANGGWTQRVAEQWLTRCAEPRLAARIEFIEQPVWEEKAVGVRYRGERSTGARSNESVRDRASGGSPQCRTDDVLLGLSADYPTPLALDESVASEDEVCGWLERGWRGVFVIKPTLLDEPAAVFAELARAKARVVFSSAMETAVGAKAALRWAFSWEGERLALGFGVYPLFRDAAFNGPRAVPFLRWEDVEAIDKEALWNALA